MTEQRRLLGAMSLVTLVATGCGGLGDGARLETVEIRGSSTLDADVTVPPEGTAVTTNNITVGRCIATSLSIFTTYSDGEEVAQAAGRAKWTSSDEDKIVIINTDDPERSLNQQFPLAIAETDGTPVKLTANFAGIEATAMVTVLPTQLKVEPQPQKIVPGILRTLTAVRMVGTGSGDSFEPLLVEPLTATSEPAAANAGIEFSVVGNDISIADSTSNGLIATAPTTGATVTATLISNFDDYTTDATTATTPTIEEVRVACADAVSFDVDAEEPADLEIVPTYVSPNSTNQSSANSLFMASSTAAQVRVNAVFDDGSKQQVSSLITWKLPDGVSADADDEGNIPNVIAVPGEGSSVIVVDADDHEQATDPELVAVLSRDDIDDVTFADIEQTLTVNVTDYDIADVAVVATAPDGGVLRRVASTPQQVLGLFGNPVIDMDNAADSSAELVLDLGAGLGSVLIESVRNNEADSSSIAFATPLLAARQVNAQDEDILDLLGDDVAVQQDLTFTYPVVDEDDSTTVTVASDSVTYFRSENDISDLGTSPQPSLSIVESGMIAAPSGGSLCIELGETVFLEALVAIGPEEIDSASTPSVPLIVTNSSIWTLDAATAPASLFVTTNGSRGTLTANGSDTGMTTVSARYINPQDFDRDTDDEKVDKTATLTIEVAAAGQCM